MLAHALARLQALCAHLAPRECSGSGASLLQASPPELRSTPHSTCQQLSPHLVQVHTAGWHALSLFRRPLSQFGRSHKYGAVFSGTGFEFLFTGETVGLYSSRRF